MVAHSRPGDERIARYRQCVTARCTNRDRSQLTRAGRLCGTDWPPARRSDPSPRPPRRVVVIHATDTASAFLQARARMSTSSPAQIDRELYEERTPFGCWPCAGRCSWCRSMTCRSSTPRHPWRSRERARADGRDVHRGGVGPDPTALLEELEATGLAAVRERGEATHRGVDGDRPATRPEDDARSGQVVRGDRSASPRRSSSTSRWTAGSAAAGRAAHGSAVNPLEPDRTLATRRDRRDAVDDARAELVRRGCGRSGPAPATTSSGGRVGRSPPRSRRWRRSMPSRWTSTEARSATSSRRPRAGEPPDPWVALLPALDARRWAGRSATGTSDGHRAALFDTAGNAGPTIWVDGRIVGGWAQRRDGEIAPQPPRGRRRGNEARDRRGGRPPCRMDRTGQAQVDVSVASRDRAGQRLARASGGSTRPSPQTSGPQKNGWARRTGERRRIGAPGRQRARPATRRSRRTRSSAGTASRPRGRCGRASASPRRRRCSPRRIGRSRRRR